MATLVVVVTVAEISMHKRAGIARADAVDTGAGVARVKFTCVPIRTRSELFRSSITKQMLGALAVRINDGGTMIRLSDC